MLFPCGLDVLDINVRVCSSMGEELPADVENSQQGRTRCPDGATSNWKVSVPGGMALAKS
jgi:hypothetical protein